VCSDSEINWRITVLLMLKSLVLSLMIVFVATGETPKIGARAPQFSLPSATGSTVSLSDYAGKSKLVVVFYRGYW
jgi:hypothetical protein